MAGRPKRAKPTPPSVKEAIAILVETAMPGASTKWMQTALRCNGNYFFDVLMKNAEFAALVRYIQAQEPEHPPGVSWPTPEQPEPPRQSEPRSESLLERAWRLGET